MENGEAEQSGFCFFTSANSGYSTANLVSIGKEQTAFSNFEFRSRVSEVKQLQLFQT